MAIKVCIISAFSTTTKGLKRPFKNLSHMRICNNLERALVSDFYFRLANVRHYYENAGFFTFWIFRLLFKIRDFWLLKHLGGNLNYKFLKFQVLATYFSSYYRTTMWRNVSKSSRLDYVGFRQPWPECLYLLIR